MINLIKGKLDESTGEEEWRKHGLFCGDGNSEASKDLCGLLDEMTTDANSERDNLISEQTFIIEQKTKIDAYKCDCNMGPWGEYDECTGKVNCVFVFSTDDRFSCSYEL